MASVALDFSFTEVTEFLAELKSLDTVVEVGLVATGPAAAYAEVWEWGNARQTKQGPKTVLGVNPDGETVWLSTQAPMGYIAVHTEQYMAIIMVELAKLALGDGEGTHTELLQVAHNAMVQIKEVVSEHAPVDSGQLRDCFQVVDDGDETLDDDPGGSVESRFSQILTLS